VFLARIIDGLTAGNLSLAQAYISDVTRPEERAKTAILGNFYGQAGAVDYFGPPLVSFKHPHSKCPPYIALFKIHGYSTSFTFPLTKVTFRSL
jgi:hypothetical protein